MGVLSLLENEYIFIKKLDFHWPHKPSAHSATSNQSCTIASVLLFCLLQGGMGSQAIDIAQYETSARDSLGVNWHKCLLCNKVYKEDKTNLRDHIYAVHLHIKRHVCNVCGKTFGWRTEKSAHRAICRVPPD